MCLILLRFAVSLSSSGFLLAYLNNEYCMFTFLSLLLSLLCLIILKSGGIALNNSIDALIGDLVFLTDLVPSCKYTLPVLRLSILSLFTIWSGFRFSMTLWINLKLDLIISCRGHLYLVSCRWHLNFWVPQH